MLEADPGRGRRAPADSRPSPGQCRRRAIGRARCSSATRSSAVSGGPVTRSSIRCWVFGRTSSSIGKALGAGIPIGAALVGRGRSGAPRLRRPREHVRRQPAGLPCRAVLRRPVARGRAAGSRRARRARTWRRGCWSSRASTPWCARCAASGLMRGLDLDRPAAPVVDAARGRGLLVNGDGADRRAHAAAADDHRDGDRSGRRSARLPRWPRSLERRNDVCHGPAHIAGDPRSAVHRAVRPSAVELREATAGDVAAIHQLIADHVAIGPPAAAHATRRLPSRIARFVVGEADGDVVACAELAPLSAAVAEVRSLVVAEHVARHGRRTPDLDALVRHAVRQRAPAALRVHARAGVLHPARVLDRPAPLGAGEGLHRLRRSARCSARAASTPSSLRLTSGRCARRRCGSDRDRGARRVTMQPMAGGITRRAGIPCGRRERRDQGVGCTRHRADRAGRARALRPPLHDQPGAGGAGDGVARAPGSRPADAWRAVLVNSGCANACTGADGLQRRARVGARDSRRASAVLPSRCWSPPPASSASG